MPPPKLANERHILGMSTGAKTIPIARKKCRLSCSLITNTPRQYRFLAVLGPVKSPAHKFGNFHRCSHADTNYVFYFNSGPNRRMINGRRSAFYWWQKAKHVLSSLGFEPIINSLLNCTIAILSYHYRAAFLLPAKGIGLSLLLCTPQLRPHD